LRERPPDKPLWESITSVVVQPFSGGEQAAPELK
jgi:hypothetical protein